VACLCTCSSQSRAGRRSHAAPRAAPFPGHSDAAPLHTPNLPRGPQTRVLVDACPARDRARDSLRATVSRLNSYAWCAAYLNQRVEARARSPSARAEPCCLVPLRRRPCRPSRLCLGPSSERRGARHSCSGERPAYAAISAVPSRLGYVRAPLVGKLDSLSIAHARYALQEQYETVDSASRSELAVWHQISSSRSRRNTKTLHAKQAQLKRTTQAHVLGLFRQRLGRASPQRRRLAMMVFARSQPIPSERSVGHACSRGRRWSSAPGCRSILCTHSGGRPMLRSRVRALNRACRKSSPSTRRGPSSCAIRCGFSGIFWIVGTWDWVSV
jgi:hypothetical protein